MSDRQQGRSSRTYWIAHNCRCGTMPRAGAFSRVRRAGNRGSGWSRQGPGSIEFSSLEGRGHEFVCNSTLCISVPIERPRRCVSTRSGEGRNQAVSALSCKVSQRRSACPQTPANSSTTAKDCGARLKPKPGDCCVFCSYGSVPCLPIQRARANPPAPAAVNSRGTASRTVQR